jgi:membrane-associated PAP2 superfamily phosphatase
MQAVEEQRRVSQQLEDLRQQQQQRTAHLSRAGLKFIVVLWCLWGTLAGAFVLLLFLEPVLLDRTLNSLSDGIAFLIMVGEQVKLELSLIPSSSWLLSVAALAVVLMMGLWIRLMRYPQEG